MNQDEFKKTYQDKGWTPSLLAKRWGFKGPRRIHQLAADENRPPYWTDAVRGLPYLEKGLEKGK